MNCDVDIELNRSVETSVQQQIYLLCLPTQLRWFHRLQLVVKESLVMRLTMESKMNALCVGCTLRMRSWRVSMNYPANSTRLGVIRVENAVISTQVNLNELLNTLSISLLLDGLHVDDRTPFYSELYPERLVLCGVNTVLPTHAEIKVVKFLGEDASRECDLQVNIVVPETMKFYYVHTHRFFCGLFDFWAQFSELQDQVAKSKRIVVLDGLTSKILLNIDVKCPTTVVLPLNQCSDDLVVLESDGFRLLNSFKRMSTIKDFFQKNFIDTDYGYDTSVDCLVDWLENHVVGFTDV
ncbi:hypothetical protein KIN20_009851 [Parelaphostrongylus tenuis]|uniref:Uncharacterized protein n=1 Tax=Parelaphostrongylus tenuis TaxID=148309 RepID=A0AAD5MR40_PARTN|nr:hypothetical protein KIN20_009851 [Parelaphostrongylus tenuis]